MKHLLPFHSNYQISLCPKSMTTYAFISSYLDIMPYSDYINNDKLYEFCVHSGSDLVAILGFRMFEQKIHMNYSAVQENHRNQGIHAMLISEVVKFARDNNCSLITANIKKSNTPSLKSAMKAGFSINDKVDLYYPDGEKKIPIFYRL